MIVLVNIKLKCPEVFFEIYLIDQANITSPNVTRGSLN